MAQRQGAGWMNEDSERLRRVENDVRKLAEEAATIRVQLDSINGTVADVVAELGGVVPWGARGRRVTVRERIHELENDRATAMAARAALRASEQAKGRSWSIYEKAGLFLLAAAGTAASIARVFGVGG